MGLAYRVVDTAKVSIAVIDAAVTADEFHSFARQQAADPAWRNVTRSLTDARTALIPAVKGDEIAAFAGLYTEARASAAPYKAAIVAGREFGLADRYSRLRTDPHTRTLAFHDVTGACIWLGVDADMAELVVRELLAGLREGAAPNTP
jgi:hypothetical protein